MVIVLVSAIAALAGLLFGFDTGIISGALLFIEKDFTLSTMMKELIVSSVLIGAMTGSVASGHLTDVLGRKRIMLVIALIFTAGTAIATAANSVPTILLGRLLIGFAIGIGSYTAPLYIAELAPSHLRGGLVTFNQLAITIGIMCSYFINYIFTDTQYSWRLMFGFGLIPALMLGIGMFFLPESPRWLVKQGRRNDARQVLQKIRKQKEVEAEINEIQNSLVMENSRFSDVFLPWIRPVLFLGIMLGFLQQVTGINTIIYYAPTIFKLAGFHDTATSILATAGIGVVNVLSTIVAVFLLDKIGRRKLLLTGLVGMGLSLSILSLGFCVGSSSEWLQYLAVISTFSYVICFAFSLGAILWLMVSEIFPLEVRGAAMGVAVFSCWFWNFAVSFTFLSLLNYLGASKTFLLYAVMCLLGWIYCYYKAPETKDVSLEKIEKNIRQGKSLRWIGQDKI